MASMHCRSCSGATYEELKRTWLRITAGGVPGSGATYEELKLGVAPNVVADTAKFRRYL